MKNIPAFLPSLLLLTACAVGPDYVPPALPEKAAWSGEDSVKVAAFSSKPVDTEWWKSGNDPVLDKFIADAAAHNHDIRIAVANLDEALALRRAEAADFYPSIGANAGGARTRTDGITVNRFDASLDAAWEPDVFGGIRRLVEASDAKAQASQADYHDVMLGVLAEVARNYFELRGLQKRIALTQQNIDILRGVEELAQSRFEYGAASEFDVTQARGEREVNAAVLPNLEAEVRAGIYRLSVLSGKPPEYYLSTLTAAAPLPMPPDMVPVGLPSDMLRRRPDIRRAERDLAAATADIGIATADMFPRFPLTGSIGTGAARFGDLFASGGFAYFVGQTVIMPLFEGGRLRAQVDAADARQRNALAAYEKSVLLALEDAEASLVRYGKEWETLKNLRTALETRREAASIARLRYESGTENFLVVLDAERALITTQDAIIQSETRVLTRLTQLYKSLGGGWEALVPAMPAQVEETNRP
ncbi:MAG: efflux transporter outer membrane subunit [Alphaproteobacteria bacterium]